MSEINIGDSVKIIKDGSIYTSYKQMAKTLCLRDWKENSHPSKNIGKIVAINDNKNICGVRINGKGYLYETKGLKVVHNEDLTANELLDYVKGHGITKVRLTEGFNGIPKGTVLYVGYDTSSISSYSSIVGDKNKQFKYDFGVSWACFWHERYKGKFVLVDDEIMDSPEISPDKEKLIDVDMDIEDIKEFPAAVLAKAEKEAKKELSDEQADIAKATFKVHLVEVANAERELVAAQKKLDDLRGKVAIAKPKK